MSRKSLLTLAAIIMSALLAVALFIAGAIWRGRVTTRRAAPGAGKFQVFAELAAGSRLEK